MEESGSPKVSGTPETTVSPEASVTPEQTISCPDGETPYFNRYEYDCCPAGGIIYDVGWYQGCCPDGGIIYDAADGYKDCCPAGGIIYDKADGYQGCCPAGGIIYDVADGDRVCCPDGGIIYDAADGYQGCCPPDGIIYDKADGDQGCCPAGGIIYNKADGYQGCCPAYKKVYVDNVTGKTGVCCADNDTFYTQDGYHYCCPKSTSVTLADGTPKCCSVAVIGTDDGNCCQEDAYYNNGALHCCPKPAVVAYTSDYSSELTCCTTGTVINEYGKPVCKGCSDEENTYTYTDVEGNLVNGCCDGDVCGEEGAQLCCEVNNSETCKTIVGSDGESSTCCPVCQTECPEGQACLNGSCTKVTCPVLLSLCQSNTNGSLNAACDYADALKAFGYNEQAMCEEAFQSEKESLDPYIDELLELDTSDTSRFLEIRSRLAEIIKELLNDSYITSVDFGVIESEGYCVQSGTCYPYKGTDEIEDDIVKTDYVCDMSGDICRNSKIVISLVLLYSRDKLPCLFSTVLHEHVHANQFAGQYGPCWAALGSSGYNGGSCFGADSQYYKRYQNSPHEQLAWCVTKKIQDYLNEKFGTSETCNKDYTDIGMIP